MLFSVNWLQRYVELPTSTAELETLLTRCGMVVENVAERRGDTTFDLDVPSNRVDAMNHVGIAREIATARRVPLRLPEATAAAGPPGAAELTSVQIDDLDGCPRYVARVVSGVRVQPSPAWLRDLLEAIGLRPLNNVADITNFVLWELGHPLHAFDLDKLAERRIVVRRARPGEKLRTLDGVDRELVADDLVIADAERPVAVAGIMGGADSAISEGSINVLLEGAWFDPAAVRRTAQRLNLKTDASHRFERSPAPDGMLAALDRAASLVAEIAGGQIAAGAIDVIGTLPEGRSTELRPDRLRRLLGVEVAPQDVEDILGRLGFEVAEAAGGYDVGVPSFRPDVAREEDLIEEVARHYGYDRLPGTLPAILGPDEAGTAEVLGERRLKHAVAAAGYCEAMSSSLGDADEQALFLDDPGAIVPIRNPISENLGVLRAHIVPGLLSAVAYNVNRGQADLRLFEVGRRFRGPLGTDGVSERWALGLVATGERRPTYWDETPPPVDLFDLKGAIEQVSRGMGWPPWRWSSGAHGGLQDGTVALLTTPGPDGEHRAAGWAGRVAAKTAAHFGIERPVWVAELDIDDLLPLRRPTVQHLGVSRFPAGVRDLALVAPTVVSYGEVRAAVQDAARRAGLPLADLGLVEIYEGPEIPADCRGMTLRFSYRAADRTLTSDEIDAATDTLTKALVTGLGMRAR